MEWAGLPSPVEGDPRFFTERAVIDHYKAHVAGLLSRENAFDGLRYGEHPAVLAWELLNEPRAGAQWFLEHAAIARDLGKPLFMGEFALRNREGFSLDERRAMYRGWFRCAWRTGAGASGPWMFANDAWPDEWDEFTFYYRDGTLPADPRNRYADLIVEAAALSGTR